MAPLKDSSRNWTRCFPFILAAWLIGSVLRGLYRGKIKCYHTWSGIGYWCFKSEDLLGFWIQVGLNVTLAAVCIWLGVRIWT